MIELRWLIIHQAYVDAGGSMLPAEKVLQYKTLSDEVEVELYDVDTDEIIPNWPKWQNVPTVKAE